MMSNSQHLITPAHRLEDESGIADATTNDKTTNVIANKNTSLEASPYLSTTITKLDRR